MPSDQDTSFARLVSLATHDLRTPLATVHGFARTIQRSDDLQEPFARYVEMIAAAASQMNELLETIGLAARIESGRYEPPMVEVDTLEAAREAAADVDGVRAEGAGTVIETDRETLVRSLAAFALCARRHGAVADVVLAVHEKTFTVSPIGSAAPVLLADDLRDVTAAVAGMAVRALGGSLAVEGDALLVRL